jgi:hypothetical protein
LNATSSANSAQDATIAVFTSRVIMAEDIKA